MPDRPQDVHLKTMWEKCWNRCRELAALPTGARMAEMFNRELETIQRGFPRSQYSAPIKQDLVDKLIALYDGEYLDVAGLRRRGREQILSAITSLRRPQ